MFMTYIKINDGHKSLIVELDQVDIFQGISLPEKNTFSFIVLV